MKKTRNSLTKNACANKMRAPSAQLGRSKNNMPPFGEPQIDWADGNSEP
jgi:hypothetical protein